MSTSFVAVSGLSSHPFGSWKERGGDFMWLRDALAVQPDGARVLLYGYETDLVKSESFQDIDDIGHDLYLKLHNIRKAQRGEINFEPRPIVFIPHSLGGLIVQEAIHRMFTEDQVNLYCVYGLIFFGVPSHGIQVSHWLPIVQNQPNEDLVRNLAPNSIYLRNLQEKFHRAFRFPDAQVVSIYETRKSKTAKEESPGVWKLTGDTDILVTRESAQASCPPGPLHIPVSFNQNHADLPKFYGEYDDAYRTIESFIDEFRQEAVIAVQRRFARQGFHPRHSNSQDTTPPIERSKTPLLDHLHSPHSRKGTAVYWVGLSKCTWPIWQSSNEPLSISCGSNDVWAWISGNISTYFLQQPQ